MDKTLLEQKNRELAITIVGEGEAFDHVNDDTNLLVWRMSEYDNAREICKAIRQTQTAYEEARLFMPPITVIGKDISPSDLWLLVNAGANVYGYIGDPSAAEKEEDELLEMLHNDLS